jgi:transcriptional regulator with XRE-family HTH domain
MIGVATDRDAVTIRVRSNTLRNEQHAMRARIIAVEWDQNGDPMNPTQAKKLGAVIRAARKTVGLSQLGLGEEVGVPNSTILRLERGENLNPRPDLLADIANALQVDLADLFALAGYSAPRQLPNLQPYLRTKYRDLSERDIAEITKYAERLMKQRGIDPGGPAPGEDEIDEPLVRKKVTGAKKKGGSS